MYMKSIRFAATNGYPPMLMTSPVDTTTDTLSPSTPRSHHETETPRHCVACGKVGVEWKLQRAEQAFITPVKRHKRVWTGGSL